MLSCYTMHYRLYLVCKSFTHSSYSSVYHSDMLLSGLVTCLSDEDPDVRKVGVIHRDCYIDHINSGLLPTDISNVSNKAAMKCFEIVFSIVFVIKFFLYY